MRVGLHMRLSCCYTCDHSTATDWFYVILVGLHGGSQFFIKSALESVVQSYQLDLNSLCFYSQPCVETFMRQYTTWSQLWSLSCYFHLMALIYSAAHSEVNALNDGIRSECHGYSVWMPRTKLQCMKCQWLLCLGFGIGEIIFVLVFVQRS